MFYTNIKNILCKKNFSIKQVMDKIDKSGLGIALIVDDNKKLLGIVSDGDIRKFLLKGKNLDSPIEPLMNKAPITLNDGLSKSEVITFVKNDKRINEKYHGTAIIKIPSINKKNQVSGIYFVLKDNESFKLLEQKLLKKKVLNKILVVGGAGYIGSILTRKLLKRGYKVTVLDNLLYGDCGIRDLYKKPNFEFIKGDILHIEDIVDAVAKNDAVVHLAAVVGDPSSRLKPKETLEINYFATQNLINICKYFNIQRFVFASTCSVYGFSLETCYEHSICNPLSLYSETKLKSEKLILMEANKQFKPTVLRFGTAYGWSPRMRFDLVVNLLIAKAIFDKKITVFGKGLQKRPFVHVEDIARAIIKTLEAPLDVVGGQVFNVGSDSQNYTIDYVAKKINEGVPDSEITYIEQKEDDRNYEVSFKKIKNILDFKPTKDISDAVKEISEEIEKGNITDYKDKKYSNYKSLEFFEFAGKNLD